MVCYAVCCTDGMMYDMVCGMTWCGMIWYAMLSIYSITTHYSTSMECTLHVLYYTTYLLPPPPLLHHHPTYLYTRARVKEKGMDGWMDGWDEGTKGVRACTHYLHTYYSTTTTYYTTTYYMLCCCVVTYGWMYWWSEWIHSSAHGWMHGGTDEVMWCTEYHMLSQLLVYRVPPWRVLHYHYLLLSLPFYILSHAMQRCGWGDIRIWGIWTPSSLLHNLVW